MSVDFLLYGSYGYTGRLIARRAVGRGLRGSLAGRDEDALSGQGAELGWPWRAFALEDREALEDALSDVPVVLHCAGPFVHTFRPVAEACLRTRTHYLDITGEADVFEALARRGASAEAEGVMLLPGVGLDVVPSDCLAAHLVRRLPGAVRLRLGIQALRSGISRGTATTMVERFGWGGLVRKDGKLVRTPAAWKSREIDFGDGPVAAITIPWGDVSTAYHSTGIGDIEVYAAAPALLRAALVLTRPLGPLLRWTPVRRLLKWAVRRGPAGPRPEEREVGEARVWGEVEDDVGGRAVARMRCPEGYTFTAASAVAVLERVLEGRAPPGFQTPSTAYGPDFVLELPGVSREDVE